MPEPSRSNLSVRGAWELALLAWTTRFRLRGRYWRWREETAFGRYPVSARERRAAAIGYGQWIGRMKRLRRG